MNLAMIVFKKEEACHGTPVSPGHMIQLTMFFWLERSLQFLFVVVTRVWFAL